MRYLYVVALVLWVGGLIVAGAVVAPSVFGVLQAWNATDGRVLVSASALGLQMTGSLAFKSAYNLRKTNPRMWMLNESGIPDVIEAVHWDPWIARTTGRRFSQLAYFTELAEEVLDRVERTALLVLVPVGPVEHRGRHRHALAQVLRQSEHFLVAQLVKVLLTTADLVVDLGVCDKRRAVVTGQRLIAGDKIDDREPAVN